VLAPVFRWNSRRIVERLVPLLEQGTAASA
jgi:hypothetical protein